nr:uncharacterized protein LOC109167327 [Ipomoea batatas]
MVNDTNVVIVAGDIMAAFDIPVAKGAHPDCSSHAFNQQEFWKDVKRKLVDKKGDSYLPRAKKPKSKKPTTKGEFLVKQGPTITMTSEAQSLVEVEATNVPDHASPRSVPHMGPKIAFALSWLRNWVHSKDNRLKVYLTVEILEGEVTTSPQAETHQEVVTKILAPKCLLIESAKNPAIEIMRSEIPYAPESQVAKVIRSETVDAQKSSSREVVTSRAREVVGGDKNAETEKLDVDAPEIQDQIPRVQLLDLI